MFSILPVTCVHAFIASGTYQIQNQWCALLRSSIADVLEASNTYFDCHAEMPRRHSALPSGTDTYIRVKIVFVLSISMCAIDNKI